MKRYIRSSSDITIRDVLYMLKSWTYLDVDAPEVRRVAGQALDEIRERRKTQPGYGAEAWYEDKMDTDPSWMDNLPSTEHYVRTSQILDDSNYDHVMDEFLPTSGEGKTRATQLVTAINALVYGWYNDGDVYDSRFYDANGSEKLADCANWLTQYSFKARSILPAIADVTTDKEYENILSQLVDNCLDAEILERLDKMPAKGSVYRCEGPYSIDN